MKLLFPILLVLACYGASAQVTLSAGAITPTGGCMYQTEIVSITQYGNPVFVLINKESYSLNVRLDDVMDLCKGDINVTLSNVKVTKAIGHFPHATSGLYTIPLDTFTVLPGIYDLTVNFTGAYAGYYDVAKVSVLETTGVNEMQAMHGITVFPIPATDVLTIDHKAFAGSIDAIRLTDVSGSQVRVIQPKQGSQITQLNVNDLPSGMYILQLQGADNVYTTKICIIH